MGDRDEADRLKVYADVNIRSPALLPRLACCLYHLPAYTLHSAALPAAPSLPARCCCTCLRLPHACLRTALRACATRHACGLRAAAVRHCLAPRRVYYLPVRADGILLPPAAYDANSATIRHKHTSHVYAPNNAMPLISGGCHYRALPLRLRHTSRLQRHAWFCARATVLPFRCACMQHAIFCAL